MSDAAMNGPVDGARSAELGPVGRFLKATELDTRMLGMVGALIIIWGAFHLLSGGLFLTPRNLWNLSVQSASVAVMATGMVLVIVTRNIDLSVGSILGFVGMCMGVTQAQLLPQFLGFGHPAIWILAALLGLGVGVAIGALHGFIIAYLGVPAFIVTLGGLLVWRGGAWWVTSGQTVAPMDATFRLMGGGPDGAVGEMWSWIIGLVACVAVVLMLIAARTQRRRFKFPQRPIWAEGFLGALACALILGAVWVANSYPWPAGVVRRYAEANNIEIPEGGLFIPHGIAIPVLIAVGVGIVMTFVTTRTRFGRYVFAIGGNPEAAVATGIPVERRLVSVFAIHGAFAGIAAILFATQLQVIQSTVPPNLELTIITATVIGGVSILGGTVDWIT